MGIPTPQLANKARAIALALRKRGSTLENDEALKLLAYPEEVLDKAIKVMRGRTNIRNAVGYFFSICNEEMTKLSMRADWDAVRLYQQNGIVLIRSIDEERTIQAQQPQVTPDVLESGSPKRGDYAKPSSPEVPYAEQVRRTQAKERAEAEARKPKEDDVDGWRKAVDELKKTENVSYFHKIGLEVAQKRVAFLEGESKQDVVTDPATLFTGQISTKTNDKVPTHVTEPLSSIPFDMDQNWEEVGYDNEEGY